MRCAVEDLLADGPADAHYFAESGAVFCGCTLLNYRITKLILPINDKINIREAYSIFEYIESINPNFEETRELMVEAHEKGKDYVLVGIENRTRQIIPAQLEYDLLDFNTYGLNQFWTVYHAKKEAAITYDYEMQLQLRRILISPEELREKQLVRKKQIVDGWEYQLDENGNVAKDSLGNDIKVDKIIEARARFSEFNQFKNMNESPFH